MRPIITILLFAIFTIQTFAQGESVTDTSLIGSPVLNSDANGVYFQSGKSTNFGEVSINGDAQYLPIVDGKAYLTDEISFAGSMFYIEATQGSQLTHISKKKDGRHRIKQIPLWMSVIPPLLAIILALIFKEVIISLFIGIWSGAFIAGGLRLDSFYYFIASIFNVVKEFVIDALNERGHISVIVFSLLIGGMVAIISKNGGMVGVVNVLTKYAKSAKSSQLVTWFLGIAIFFDDYANTLIVGNTMRPVTDKFRVSREKLSYIVDATAAPVAAIAFITTWIGAELGYIDDGLQQIGLDTRLTPYGVFISSLKYAYYSIFTLIFMFMLIWMGRDYGPMLKAERRARKTGQVSPARTADEDEPNMEDLSPVKNAPLKWSHAVLPVLTVVFMTLFGLMDTGMDALYAQLDPSKVYYSWSSIWDNIAGLSKESSVGFFKKLGMVIGASDSYSALLWASLSGVIVAIIITVANKTMKLFDTMFWLVSGFKTMLPALVILCLAWSLAKTTDALHTADFISGALTGNVSPLVLPSLIFITAALISFSTGSSWSTMAILYPIAIPTTYAICVNAGMEQEQTLEILYSVIATVLSASVLGDHCSPISDTTILSSLASDCNHLDHVKTQMPYALTVGAISLVCKGLATVLGGSAIVSWLMFLLAIVAMYLIIRYLGQKVEDTVVIEHT